MTNSEIRSALTRDVLARMRRAGYDTKYMDSRHKHLGATMAERRGTVSDWLRRMDLARLRDLHLTLGGDYSAVLAEVRANDPLERVADC